MTAIFRCPGAVAAGLDLMGQHSWSTAMQATRVIVTASAGTARVVLALTVGGVATAVRVAIEIGETRVVSNGLELSVAAGAMLGVEVIEAGTAAANPSDVTVTVDVAEVEESGGSGGSGGSEETGESDWLVGAHAAVPILFRCPGPLYAGVTMQGAHVFSQAMAIESGVLECHAGTVAVTVTVRIGGAGSDVRFEVAAGQTRVEWVGSGDVVPSNTEIAASVTVSGAAGECPTDAVLILTMRPMVTYPAMGIRYVGARERAWLYWYDPVTRLYTEAGHGATTGRGGIIVGEDRLTIWVGLFTVAVIDTRLIVSAITQTEQPSQLVPRLEFVISDVVVASFDSSGLRATAFDEPVVTGREAFEFEVGGVVVCSIAANGVSADEIEEGTPT